MPAAGAGNIEQIGAWDVYEFTASAGDEIFFDRQEGQTLLKRWWLIDPQGGEVFDTFLYDDPGIKTMPVDGTYRMYVGSVNRPGTGTYKIQLWEILPPRTETLTEAGTYTLTIGHDTDRTGMYQLELDLQ